MSGGSYNYLCWNTDDLSSRAADIHAMEHRLRTLDCPGAARATHEVIRALETAQRMAEALTDVWHAVELLDSGDSGEDLVRKAVAEFQPWPPAG